MANAWTPERRAQQSEAIRRWQPWTRSTGPRTEDGKGRTRLNAYKGGERPTLRALARVLQDQRRALADLLGWGHRILGRFEIDTLNCLRRRFSRIEQIPTQASAATSSRT